MSGAFTIIQSALLHEELTIDYLIAEVSAFRLLSLIPFPYFEARTQK